MRVLLLWRFLNTTRVPEMAHPSKNILGNDTSLRRQIFRHFSNRMINPTVTLTVPCAGQQKLLQALLWNCVTLFGTTSPSLALRRPISAQSIPQNHLSATSEALCVLCVNPYRACAVSPTPHCLFAMYSSASDENPLVNRLVATDH